MRSIRGVLTAVMLAGTWAIIVLAQGNEIGEKTTKLSDMPTARFNFRVTRINDELYMMGGFSPGFLQTVEAYNLKTRKWSRKADLPVRKNWFGACMLDGKLYTVGGRNSGGPISRVDVYDAKSNTWERKADMPTSRMNVEVAAIEGRLYAVGGLTQQGAVRRLDVYDPKSDTWKKKADMLVARQLCSLAIIDGKLYAIGGLGLSSVERYDPSIDAWEKIASLNEAGRRFGNVLVDGTLYVVGGSDKTRTVERYDSNTHKWSVLRAKTDEARWGCGSLPVYWGDGRLGIYIAGGATVEFDTHGHEVDAIWTYYKDFKVNVLDLKD